MVLSITPLLIATLGLLMWGFSSNQKAAEAGKILFFCGALVFTMNVGGKVLRF